MDRLSEKEKYAIENLKEINQAIKYRPMFSIPSDTKLFDTILNLIEKQSKEIEELKEENKEYQIGFAQGCYEKDLDWEDKIKVKIEELEEIIEFEKPTYEDVLKYAIEILQSLLEKE